MYEFYQKNLKKWPYLMIKLITNDGSTTGYIDTNLSCPHNSLARASLIYSKLDQYKNTFDKKFKITNTAHAFKRLLSENVF